MSETLQATVPAHPNGYVARFIPTEGDEKESIELEPIIAWKVWRDDDKGTIEVCPITIGGRQQLNGYSLLKSPDGTFIRDNGWPHCNDNQSALEFLRPARRVAQAGCGESGGAED
jgi:hypothetical protein